MNFFLWNEITVTKLWSFRFVTTTEMLQGVGWTQDVTPFWNMFAQYLRSSQSEIFGGLSIFMLVFQGGFVVFSVAMGGGGGTPHHSCMKNIGKNTTFNLRETFLKFCSICTGWWPTINSWNNLRGGVLQKRMVPSHCMGYTNIVNYPPKIMEV